MAKTKNKKHLCLHLCLSFWRGAAKLASGLAVFEAESRATADLEQPRGDASRESSAKVNGVERADFQQERALAATNSLELRFDLFFLMLLQIKQSAYISTKTVFSVLNKAHSLSFFTIYSVLNKVHTSKYIFTIDSVLLEYILSKDYT